MIVTCSSRYTISLNHNRTLLDVCPSDGCIPRPSPGPQSGCCMGTIRTSGALCSATMVAPCIIDDPCASCKYLSKTGARSLLGSSTIFLAIFHGLQPSIVCSSMPAYLNECLQEVRRIRHVVRGERLCSSSLRFG